MRASSTGISLGSLLSLAVAKSEIPHAHRHRHALSHGKRIQVTVTDPNHEQSTEVPEIYVYVDNYGEPVQTATETVVIVPATSAPAPAASVALSPSTAGGHLFGISYSPYLPGGCKSAAEVDADFAIFAKDYGVVRLYGVDCNQVANAYVAAKYYGNKLMLGIFDITQVPQGVEAITEGVNYDWDIVDTVTVGNELVNDGAASVATVVSAVNQARAALRAAGYTGPVVIVDTFVAVENYPELCEASDYCAVNCHPFFDAAVSAAEAGAYIDTQVGIIRSKLSNPYQRIVITETGWPWYGTANGAAVPSLANQATAIASIKQACSNDPTACMLFTAFNDLWKQAEASTFYAEQFWGIGGQYSPSEL